MESGGMVVFRATAEIWSYYSLEKKDRASFPEGGPFLGANNLAANRPTACLRIYSIKGISDARSKSTMASSLFSSWK
jgi:hypothetical protein